MRRFIWFIVGVLSKTPVMAWFRTARGYRDQYVDPQVRQLRTLVRQMRSGRVDVLFLGDSSATFFGPGEADQRRLPEMLAAELGGEKVALIAGPGYGPELQAEFVRLLTTLPQRPKAVVLGCAVRVATSTNIVKHPRYGYRRSIETLRSVSDAHHHIRAFSRRNRRTAQDTSAFRALPVSTRWAREKTIGDFLTLVRGRRDQPETLERQQAVFDYLHGETVTALDPQLDQVRILAERLTAYGVPVVHYWAPIPAERGETYFPGEFADHIRANFEVVQNAFAEGTGSSAQLVETPLDTPDDEFIDSADGSEHWNEAGRRRIAKKIAEALRETGAF